MALSESPALSGRATGSVGELTYSEDEYGTTTRSRISPNFNRSDSATNFRNRAFQNCSFQYQNLSAASLEFWEAYSENHVWYNKLGQQIRLHPRQWYMKFCLTHQLYFFSTSDFTPPPYFSRYIPTVTCEWSSSGAVLSWDTAIPTFWAIVVWQLRNLRTTQVRTKQVKRSHVFLYPTTSPQFISGSLLESNNPPGFPAILSNTWINIRVKIVDVFGWSPPIYTFRINAT